jgi:hypothetical protein
MTDTKGLKLLQRWVRLETGLHWVCTPDACTADIISSAYLLPLYSAVQQHSSS